MKEKKYIVFLMTFFSFCMLSQNESLKDNLYRIDSHKIYLVGENHNWIDTSIQFNLIRNSIKNGKKIILFLEASYSSTFLFDSVFKERNLKGLNKYFKGQTLIREKILFEFIDKNNFWDKIRVVGIDLPNNRIDPIVELSKFLFENEFNATIESIKNRAFLFPRLVRKSKLKKMYKAIDLELVRDSNLYIGKYGRKQYNKFLLNSLGTYLYLNMPKGKYYSTLRDTFMYQCILKEQEATSLSVCVLGGLHTTKSPKSSAPYQDKSTVYVKNFYYYLDRDNNFKDRTIVYKYIHPNNKESNLIDNISIDLAQKILNKCTEYPCLLTNLDISSMNEELGNVADFFIVEKFVK